MSAVPASGYYNTVIILSNLDVIFFMSAKGIMNIGIQGEIQ